nr:hypothetical protein [Tanacetum cinerariifolium]
MIFDGMVRNINNKVSKFLMYPRFLSICLRKGQFGKIPHTHTYVVPFHTRKLFTTLRGNSPSFSGRTFPLFDSIASILTSRGVQVVPTGAEVAIASVSIPAGSGVFPTASPTIPTAALIFTTATDSIPYTRRKGKEKMRMNEQIARDAEISRIHAEEELQMLIDGLDRNNENVAKYLQEYYQFAIELPIERMIELISDLKEAERFKRKCLRLEQKSVKKLKTSEEVKATEEVPKEKVKEMMQLVPVEEIYVEALQVKHLIIDWKVHTEGQRSYWKIIRLGGSSASYQFFVDMLKHFDREDSAMGIVEATKAVRVNELKVLKERNVALEGRVETTCSGLRDKVMGYKLFKEWVEEMHDEHVRVLSDRVACIDSNLMDMALHMDEEFYPCYLTTVVGRRWILSRGLKLVIMKWLQSSEYSMALGGAIGRVVDKGMQDGLAAGIDHGKVERNLFDVSAYYPFAKANYVAAITTLRAVHFPFLSQLESQKVASMADIMDLFRLEGSAAKAPKASHLQPSLEQLMVPIHQLEDQVVIGEISLSFSLDVAHTCAQRIRGDAAARRLSLTDAMVPLIEPLSANSL